MISTSLRVSLFMLAAALPAYAQNYPTKCASKVRCIDWCNATL